MTVKELAFMLTQVPQDAEILINIDGSIWGEYVKFEYPKMFYYNEDINYLYLGGK